MEISEQIRKETDPIYQKVSKFIPEVEWAFHAPLIHKINKLKKEKQTTFMKKFLKLSQKLSGHFMLH